MTSNGHPPLVPFPLDGLLRRIDHEFATRTRIFDLVTARFFDVSDGPDLSASFLGRPIATPVGPAAGPHSQLAQNIVLSWLGGSRLIELKTVQILDELEIGRPCIDMQTIGYNIEWSQELKIPQSLEEYVKAWMIIEILRHWEPLRPLLGDETGPMVFDLSVGYDLAGISTPEVAAYIDGLLDASDTIERLRTQIPEPFAEFRDLEFEPRVADTVTLSTFHGCPPDEIESITKHLMTRHELDVVVKLNPTLLGFERVQTLVNEELGYDEVRLRREDFDADLQFDRGIELIGGLLDFATERGRRFGIKGTNTLVVANHKGWMPDDTMYLSGPPLHVVTTTLLSELDKALPGLLDLHGGAAPIQVSFSAGITRDNLANIVGCGIAPATVCSDLLKPGGYGRLKPMLKALQSAITAAGASSLGEYVSHRAEGADGNALAAYAAELHDPETGAVYRKAANVKLPREVDHVLEMWDCVACNFCVTVCPNDAFFRLPTPEGAVTPDGEPLEARQQYFVLVEACNECGNCLTFCPEEGDPAMIKPRLFTDRYRFETDTVGLQRFFIAPDLSATPENTTAADADLLTTMLRQEEGAPYLPS